MRWEREELWPGQRADYDSMSGLLPVRVWSTGGGSGGEGRGGERSEEKTMRPTNCSVFTYLN
jgi:hypothetical protein